MPPAKPKPKPTPRVTVEWVTEGDDEHLVAWYRTQRYRILLSDGRTVDVMAHRNDSDLMGAVLDRVGAKGDVRVVGVATVEDGPEVQTRPML